MRSQSPLAALQSPIALSPRIVLQFFPFAMLGPLTFDYRSSNGSFSSWVLIALLGYAVLAITIFFSKQVIEATNAPLTPVKIIGIYALAQLLRGITIGQSSVSARLAADQYFTFRTVGSIPYTVGLLIMLAVITHSYIQHQQLVLNLNDQQTSLIAMRDDLANKIENQKDRVIQEVRSSLDEPLKLIDEQLSKLPETQDNHAAVAALNLLIDSKVRPLSRQIQKTIDIDIESDVKPVSREKETGLPKHVNIGQSIRPGFNSTLFFAMNFGPMIRYLSLTQTLTYLPISLAFCYLFARVSRRVLGRRTTPFWLATVIVGAIFFAMAPVFLSFIPNPNHILTDKLLKLSAPIGLVFGFLNVLYTAVLARHNELISSLEVTVDELSGLTNNLRQEDWLNRRRVSYIIHGKLQAALHAASFQLLNSESNSAVDLNKIRSNILEAMDDVGTQFSGDMDLEEFLSNIESLWEGVCAVSWTLKTLEKNLLNVDTTLTACVCELLQEACSNAIRHGSAKNISIAFKKLTATIEITVIDDGKFWSANAEKGLGLQLYSEVCVDWNVIKNEPTGSILKFTLTTK